MDPVEALRLCRAYAAQMHLEDRPIGMVPTPEFVQHARDFAETFEGLDEWLKEGGFLPSDWQMGAARDNAEIVARLRELPWGEDVDINGGDLVDLVGQLLASSEPSSPPPGSLCWTNDDGNVVHRKCHTYADGTITNPRATRADLVVVHDSNGA